MTLTRLATSLVTLAGGPTLTLNEPNLQTLHYYVFYVHYCVSFLYYLLLIFIFTVINITLL